MIRYSGELLSTLREQDVVLTSHLSSCTMSNTPTEPVWPGKDLNREEVRVADQRGEQGVATHPTSALRYIHTWTRKTNNYLYLFLVSSQDNPIVLNLQFKHQL